MFKHVVLSRLKESAHGKSRADHARFMKERFDCEFDSRAAYEGYVTHPAHQAIVDAIKDIRTERRLIDWET